MRVLQISLMFLMFIVWSNPSWAKKVYSPIVHEGELEFENQNEVFRSKDPVKDGQRKHQFELSYGVTEWWHTGVYAVYEQTPLTALNYTESKWVNIFQLTPQGKYGLDVGLYIEYIKPASQAVKPDVLELILLFEKPVDVWKHTLNLVFKQALWNGSSTTDLGFAWRSRYNMNNGLEPAIEAYGSLGSLSNMGLNQQTFLMGPVVAYELSDNIELDAGWLVNASEGLFYGDFKLNVEYKF